MFIVFLNLGLIGLKTFEFQNSPLPPPVSLPPSKKEKEKEIGNLLLQTERGNRQNGLGTPKSLFLPLKMRRRTFELKSSGCVNTVQEQLIENVTKVMF